MARVFISHSHNDNDQARRIHEWLVEDGHDVSLDFDVDDGVAVGEVWRPWIFQELRDADALIVVVTPSLLSSPWCAAELGAALQGGKLLLPVRASAEPLDAQQRRVDELLRPHQFADMVGDPVNARAMLRNRLAKIDGSAGLGWQDGKSPYPGLEPFQRDDHRVFFGRHREIIDVAEGLRAVREPAVWAVVGPSGCGKSSLVRAGVLPRINDPAGEWLALDPITPGGDPAGSLRQAIVVEAHRWHLPADAMSFDTSAPLDGQGLADMGRELLIGAEAGVGCKVLITVDQFEELITQTSDSKRQQFVDVLNHALQGRFQVLATLRPEFLQPVLNDPALMKLGLRTHLIGPLGSDEALSQVITRPAEVAGYRIAEGLTETLVQDTGSGDALPLLAYTLKQLAQDVPRGGELTFERYHALGGVKGALIRHADAALAQACAAAGVGEDTILRGLLNLVTIDDDGNTARRPAALDRLKIPEGGLDPFVDARLVMTSPSEDGHTYVTVTHESLYQHWPTLAEQVEDKATALRARRKLNTLANDWDDDGQPPGALLTGAALTAMKAQLAGTTARHHPDGDLVKQPKRFRLPRSWRLWRNHEHHLDYKVDLSNTEQHYLGASTKHNRGMRQRRAAKQVGIAGLVLALAGAGALAVNSRHEATKRERARAATTLVYEATDLLESGRGEVEAYHKLLAADDLRPGIANVEIAQALNKLAATSRVLDTGQTVYALSLKGRRIASLSDNWQNLQLWDMETGQPHDAGPLQHPSGGRLSDVQFDPTGRWIAAVHNIDGEHDSLLLWDVQTGQPHDADPLQLPGGGRFYYVTFDPTGRWIAGMHDVDGEHKSLLLWDVQTGQPHDAGPLQLPSGGWFSDVRFDPKGRWIAVVHNVDGEHDSLLLWDMRTGLPHDAGLLQHRSGGPMSGVQFDPKGRWIAAVGGDGRSVQLWDVQTGQPHHAGPLQYPSGGRFSGVQFDPTGRWIVAVQNIDGEDDSLLLWDVETGQPHDAGPLQYPSGAQGLQFDPTGRWIAAVQNIDGEDDSLLLWDVQTGQPHKASPLQHPSGQPIRAVTFGPEGRWLASVGSEPAYAPGEPTHRSAQVWDIGSGERVGPLLTGRGTGPILGEFNPIDPATFIVSLSDGIVRWWDAQSSGYFPDHQGVQALSSDAKRVVNTGIDNASANTTLRVWVQETESALPGGTTIFTLTAGWPLVAFSADGHQLASYYLTDDHADQSAGFLRIQDIEQHTNTTATISDLFYPRGEGSTSLAVSPEGRWFAYLSTREDRHVTVADLTSIDGHGEPTSTLPIGLPYPPSTMAFSATDPNLLANATVDGTIHVLDVENAKHLAATAHPLPGPITALAFSPFDPTQLAIADSGGRLWMWDFTDGQPFITNRSNPGGTIDALAFSDKGHVIAIVSGPAAEPARVWYMSANPEDLCKKLTVNMTTRQWSDWIAEQLPGYEYKTLCKGLPTPA
ncbi:TIR domain-containing protein [Mycobacterium spongiae]|uniref:nSTAND1 domain-containing NTPase n=1 Tax=Mycobacterium spongiae TaxID=886343 RepID=UPI001BA708B8|nr:TIR domain-containing protein [Mycobacterium spongiae]